MPLPVFAIVTYLITFVTYGSHLHGEEGTIDRVHNRPGSPGVGAHPGRAALERRLMDQPPYIMDQPRRDAVLAAIIDRCAQRGWALIAAHVRTNHVHLVVDAEEAPERIMNDLKSYASRVLNQSGLDRHDRKRWARHGSTRWLAGRKNVDAAIKYVAEKQGDPMATYVASATAGVS